MVVVVVVVVVAVVVVVKIAACWCCRCCFCCCFLSGCSTTINWLDQFLHPWALACRSSPTCTCPLIDCAPAPAPTCCCCCCFTKSFGLFCPSTVLLPLAHSSLLSRAHRPLQRMLCVWLAACLLACRRGHWRAGRPIMVFGPPTHPPHDALSMPPRSCSPRACTTRTHARTRTQTCTHAHTYRRAHTHTRKHTLPPTHAGAQTHTRTHLRTHTRADAHTQVTHPHIHPFTHRQALTLTRAIPSCLPPHSPSRPTTHPTTHPQQHRLQLAHGLSASQPVPGGGGSGLLQLVRPRHALGLPCGLRRVGVLCARRPCCACACASACACVCV